MDVRPLSVQFLSFSYSFCIKLTNSAIHKAAGSLVIGRSLQNGKMSKGSHCTVSEAILYGGRQSGGFVNSAVN